MLLYEQVADCIDGIVVVIIEFGCRMREPGRVMRWRVGVLSA